MNPTITIAIDTGAASVKGLVLAGQSVLEKVYLLHRGNAGEAALSLLKRWLSLYRESVGQVVFTGSAGKFLAKAYGLPYVEEEKAIRSFLTSRGISPDFTLEIGGESAKLTRFHPSYDRRENRTCAGGTGAFLQHASRILSIPLTELDGLAEKGKRIYPIASRCGVFAKTDIQALLNEGVSHEDIALSVFQSVVNQTISGLTCGRPVHGKVAFLGGPLTFQPMLRERFQKTLDIADEDMIDKVVKQIDKRVDILKAYYNTDEDLVFQEIALYKLSTELFIKMGTVEDLIRKYNARILEMNETCVVLEKSGHYDETQALFKELSETIGVLQFIRSGRVAITKSRVERLSDMLADMERKLQEKQNKQQ